MLDFLGWGEFLAEELTEKKTYTLNDIAKELGVNKATVSKAISGKGSLSAETRARILAFTEKCGYRPNAVAQSLARSRTYNIGLIMPGDAGIFDMAFFRDCMHGVCKAGAAAGYDILVTMDSEHPVESLIRLIENRKIDGAIAMRSLVESSVVSTLKEKKFPFVLIGSTPDPEVISVDNDNRGACRDLITLLIARGVRKMALLGGDENICVTHSRLQGFWDACDQAGLSRNTQMVWLNTTHGEQIGQLVDQALAEKVQCIVCMDDYICNLVLIHLRTGAVRVPADVEVVSFYDNTLLERNIPPVTSLRFDASELGGIACRMLINRLEGRPDEHYVLPGYQMILRDSTK